VSRTFTPGASVSPETREKVIEAARVLGYRPNAIARSLITRKSRIIGVAMSYLDNQFYPEVLQALSGRLQALGFHLLLFTTAENDRVDPVIEQAMEYRVDGLILASITLSAKLAEECCTVGIPIVMFNRAADRTDISAVTGDNVRGSARMASFLVAGGHKRIAFVAGLEQTSTSRDRERGFRARLEELGCPLAFREVGDYSFAKAQEAARRLFSVKRPPDAVFCANDHMAIAVMEVARHEFGLSTPDDVSIVGFDDVGPARWPSYAITSIEQPVAAMVDCCVQLLVADLESPNAEPCRQIVVPGDLIVRNSARIPAGVIEREGCRVWREE
jgi:DNA-binding LacI/PurR family transcriptional regulator